jgi:hypothetical protein
MHLEILQLYQYQYLHCDPLLLEVLLVLLILTEQGSVSVDYQLLHTPSHTCRGGNR